MTCYGRLRRAGELGRLPKASKPSGAHSITEVGPDGTRGVCSICGDTDLYYRPSRRYYVCGVKRRADSARRRASPNFRRTPPSYWITRKYGLTADEHAAMWVEQDGACAICGSERNLRVDHSHKSGAVRALLCHDCNVGIGWLRDDPKRLRAAAHYVELLG